MKAIIQDGYGAPRDVLKLGTTEMPTYGDNEVLVRVSATSVNTPDWIAVTGTPRVLRLQSGLRRPKRPIRGTDFAGIVEAVGADVSDLKPGDEVFGSASGNTASNRAGTFAEYAVAPASRLIKKPASLSFVEAASAVMSGLTAMIGIRDVGRVGSGTSVLINGASGGVGTFAIQIAKMLGAEVTAVCSARNADVVRTLGADHVVDYTKQDVTELGLRYDVVLDNVLNHSPAKMAGLLADDGVFIPNSVGNTGGWLAGLPRMGRAVLMGIGSANVKTIKCDVNRETLADLATLLGSGDVKVVIDREYPLAEAVDAVAHMLGHHARGKVAIVV